MTHNRYGDLLWDDRHFVKLNGSYHLPWGIILGAGFGWRSGRPYLHGGWASDHLLPGTNTNAFNNYVYSLDPPGTHRMGHAWWLDLRLIKDFSIRDTELSVILDAFNVTNNQFVIRRWYWDDETFGQATDWMDAGTFVVGLKYSF